MKVLKNTSILCCLLFCFLSVFAQARPVKSTLSYLYVLSAKSATLSHISQHGFQLTLHHVDSHILRFTDRPNRKAGLISTNHFLQNWAVNFKNVPPNIALVHVNMMFDEKGEQQPAAMELSHPQIKHNEITFVASKLKGYPLSPGKLLAPRLFIDSLGNLVPNEW